MTQPDVAASGDKEARRKWLIETLAKAEETVLEAAWSEMSDGVAVHAVPRP